MALHRGSKQPNNSVRNIFRNEKGAIDLSSIMVGIIVIGLIGGVISATIFAIIPWAQDNAAKQQLDSIVSAQSAYKGLSSSGVENLPHGHAANSYGSSEHLETAGLLTTSDTYCTTPKEDGNGFYAVAKSGSGKYFAATDIRTSPVEVAPTDLTNGCAELPYIDEEPTLTKLTFRCDTATTVLVPIRDGKGTATWSDGTTKTYTGSSLNEIRKNLEAGVEYKFTFEGTYTQIGGDYQAKPCLRSIDHWGSETGVINADEAFSSAYNLTDVPSHIPPTLKSMKLMLAGTDQLNDPDISGWDVSNVTDMTRMFERAKIFNQPLNGWDVSNVTEMTGIFATTEAFNQPLNNWDVSNVTDMTRVFFWATSFDQPIGNWDVSNVTNMNSMFSSAEAFDQPLNNWDVSNVENMDRMFWFARNFDQPLTDWNVSKVTDMSYLFASSGYTQPLNGWNVSNVTNMKGMFSSTSYDQSLDQWDVSNVTNMSAMFSTAQKYSKSLNMWDVSNVKDMSRMFSTTSHNQSLDQWDVSNVTDMSEMFFNSYGFKQPLYMWDVSKVTNMQGMFKYASYDQDISNWNTASLLDGTRFAHASFPDNFMPPRTSK